MEDFLLGFNEAGATMLRKIWLDAQDASTVLLGFNEAGATMLRKMMVGTT